MSWFFVAVASATAVYYLLGTSIPWLHDRALAYLTSRSSHTEPTPQGAGIIIIPVVLAAAALGASFSSAALPGDALYLLNVASAALLLMIVGFADDSRHVSISTRLVAQSIAVVLLLFALPAEARILPSPIPLLVERTIVFFAVLWFVNLVNFMDGMDWISAVETVSITAGVIILAVIGLIPGQLGWWAAALLGAMLGFMPWNAPPARVFLGDAGSLPLGLLMAMLLVHVALAGFTAAALILPLYYLADATITLVLRMLRGERLWQAHRDHFYQRALRRCWPVSRVLIHIAVLNGTLLLIALGTAILGTLMAAIVGVAISAALTGGMLLKLGGIASVQSPPRQDAG